MKNAFRIIATACLAFVTTPLLAQEEPAADTTIQTILSFWPFIVVLVLLLLAVLWYQYIQSRRRIRRDETRRHTARPNQIVFLGIVTVFALIMLAMPWFLGTFEDNVEQVQTEQMMDPENRIEVTLEIEGMTCTGCEGLIQRRVGELPGVESVKADHTIHEAVVVYDKSRINPQLISSAIEEAGYQVVTEKP